MNIRQTVNPKVMKVASEDVTALVIREQVEEAEIVSATITCHNCNLEETVESYGDPERVVAELIKRTLKDGWRYITGMPSFLSATDMLCCPSCAAHFKLCKKDNLLEEHWFDC